MHARMSARGVRAVAQAIAKASMRGAARRLMLGLAIWTGGAVHAVSAQARPIRPSGSLGAVHALDAWIVTRYRGAQLLPDSLAWRGVAGDAPAPRVESAGDAASGDTLFAVQFRAGREPSSLRPGARVRLAGASGSISTITADLIARRPFRAPRRPGADTASRGGWRYGWVYLAIVRRRNAATPASVYRGWLLLEAPDSTRRR